MTEDVNVNCISTFEGVYQFTYEVDYGGGGICDNEDSQIRACQDPGSSYVDNQVFRIQYAKCRDVATSQNKRRINFFFWSNVFYMPNVSKDFCLIASYIFHTTVL